MTDLAAIQTRLRQRGLLLDPTGGWGPNTAAAVSSALDRLDALDPLPVAPHPKFPMPVILEAIAGDNRYRVPASVTLAQWAVESNWGKSVTGKWNYGGITARVTGAVFPTKPGTPLEPATLCWTHEEIGGKRVKCQRWFKDFDSPAAFFEAHSKLLGTSKYYAEARSKLPDVLAFVDALDPDYKVKAKDPNWAAYATATNYAETLRSIIRSNNLMQYDWRAA